MGRRRLGWVAAGLGLYLLLVVTVRRRIQRPADGNSLSASPCRPDMQANALPPLAEDSATMLQDLFTYLTTPNQRTCRKVVKFGGLGILLVGGKAIVDGHKYACMDPELGLLSTEDCLVYSVGISKDWTFDWDMEMFGCVVHAFDPSINASANQNGTIYFHKYGVAGENIIRDKNGWRLLTLDSLVERLGHANRKIHYLKMDVDEAEWGVLFQQVARGPESVLFRNVEQFAMELHFYRHMPLANHVEFYREVYRSFLELQKAGFCLFSYEPNEIDVSFLDIQGVNEKVRGAFEVVWLKTRCVPSFGR